MADLAMEWADWNGTDVGHKTLDEAVRWFWENWGPCKLFGDDDGWWMEDEYTGAVVGQTHGARAATDRS